MAVVRGKEAVSVRVPGSVFYTGIAIGAEYDPDDPLVKAYPWAFESDTPDRKSKRGTVTESVTVEAATRAPGEKRK